MIPDESVIERLAAGPVIESAEHSGLFLSKPARDERYLGHFVASLNGVTGEYTAYDRPAGRPLGEYLDNGDERGRLITDEDQATIEGAGAQRFIARLVSETHSTQMIGAGGSGAVSMKFNAMSLERSVELKSQVEGEEQKLNRLFDQVNAAEEKRMAIVRLK